MIERNLFYLFERNLYMFWRCYVRQSSDIKLLWAMPNYLRTLVENIKSGQTSNALIARSAGNLL